MIAFTCPHCETAGNYSDYLGGYEMPCQFCRSPIRVPEAGSETNKCQAQDGMSGQNPVRSIASITLGILGLIAFVASVLIFSCGLRRWQGSGHATIAPELLFAGIGVFLLAVALVLGSGALARRNATEPKKETWLEKAIDVLSRFRV